MKNIYLFCLLILSFTVSNGSENNHGKLTKNFILGNPDIQSVNALAFGPEGILFIGDSKSAMVYAIDTEDINQKPENSLAQVKKLDEKVASALGTTADKIIIQDMVVNPVSKSVYLAVHHINGTPGIVKVEGEKIKSISLSNIKYSSVSLADPVATDAKDRRGRALRVWAISDLGYHNNQIMVSGLSNKEFSSTFRSIEFPFNDAQTQASLEIYHAAHGRYETYAPIKTFTTAQLKGKSHLIAGYTCTPLVVFPMDNIQPEKHTKGRTVAELGSWNTPLDMITMEKEGESYLLVANSNRALMKISYDDLETYNDSLTEPVAERSGTAGVHFVALPFVNVTQMDKLDDKRFVYIQRDVQGDLNLNIANDRWL